MRIFAVVCDGCWRNGPTNPLKPEPQFWQFLESGDLAPSGWKVRMGSPQRNLLISPGHVLLLSEQKQGGAHS